MNFFSLLFRMLGRFHVYTTPLSMLYFPLSHIYLRLRYVQYCVRSITVKWNSAFHSNFKHFEWQTLQRHSKLEGFSFSIYADSMLVCFDSIRFYPSLNLASLLYVIRSDGDISGFVSRFPDYETLLFLCSIECDFSCSPFWATSISFIILFFFLCVHFLVIVV